MSTMQILDAAGRRRSPATLPGFHAGRPLRNKGFRYPPDPPRIEEIIGMMRQAGESDHGLDPGRGSVLVRQGKGGKRREAG
jgi:hypothetical protein